ncbi:MAG: zf-HC2 domain-containing protein [Treponema sp.]|nr:zf-HC2 domain-containing protein [Treponema sp.]
MFHCPENDIHSIYLDGELPQNFVKDYEAHLASCPKCAAKLEKLKAVHEAFKADARSIEVSDDFKAASFERLQSRMRFSKSVKASEPSKNIVRLTSFVPLAAAAAAVFALLLPLRIKAAQSQKNFDESVLAVSAVKPNKAIAENDIIVDGALSNVALSKNAEAPLTIKASDFESLKSDNLEQSDGLTISVTKLTNLNSISASNVSNARLDALDFLK